eukprot:3538113-Amphidinium_carterae.1
MSRHAVLLLHLPPLAHGKAVLLQDAEVLGGQQLCCIARCIECNGRSLPLVRQHSMRNFGLESAPMMIRVHTNTANLQVTTMEVAQCNGMPAQTIPCKSGMAVSTSLVGLLPAHANTPQDLPALSLPV